MHDRRGPSAELDICMTGQPLLENSVCHTGSSVRHSQAVCMTGGHLLEMLCA